MQDKSSEQLFIAQSVYYIKLSIPRLEKCLSRLSEDQIWHKPNENTNSIANLIMHLSGNIRQYIISALGEQPDSRIRADEFSVRGGKNKSALLNLFNNTTDEACAVITNLTSQQLNAVYLIQGFKHTGVSSIIHVTEHLSYHIGQIALLTKLITNTDLSFYGNQNLNIKNA
ncbi:MAG: DUF1572 domain-containing protein [Cyclobacteriaceae bacterium]|nr:DUF1572 domain-containing protein [Cyclobacteriaceae bacterium]